MSPPTPGPSAGTGEVEGHSAVVLTAGPTSATFVPDVGLLGASLRHRGHEYLDVSGGTAKAASGRTTGLPLMAPWANRLAGREYRVGRHRVDLRDVPGLRYDPNGLPIHGTMIGRPGWQVQHTTVTPDGGARMVARFDAAVADVVMASFPFPHELEVVATVTEGRLEVVTSLTATGRRRVPVAFGWHPYFALPDEELDDLRLHLPGGRRLELDERMLPTGASHDEAPSRRPLPPAGLDDAYALTAGSRALRLEGRRHAVSLHPGSGYHHAQAFAEAGAPIVALEPMVAPIAGLGTEATPLVEPGATYTARFHVDLH